MRINKDLLYSTGNLHSIFCSNSIRGKESGKNTYGPLVVLVVKNQICLPMQETKRRFYFLVVSTHSKYSCLDLRTVEPGVLWL